MATMPRTARTSTRFQNFGVLEKMAKGRLGKDLDAYVAGALASHEERGATEAAKRPDMALATRVAYVLSLAEDVYGNRKRAIAFLKTHHSRLGATPLVKLETEWGGREVERMLQSIIHGLPA